MQTVTQIPRQEFKDLVREHLEAEIFFGDEFPCVCNTGVLDARRAARVEGWLEEGEIPTFSCFDVLTYMAAHGYAGLAPGRFEIL